MQAAAYRNYLDSRNAGEIEAAEERNGYIYYAIRARRDVPFPNGTSAWVNVTERYKAKLPEAGK